MNVKLLKGIILSVGLSATALSGNAVAGKSQTECVKLAMSNGYGGPTCASSFIQTCMEATSRVEVEKELQFDMGPFGTGRSKRCGPPGEPGRDRYAAEWNRITKANDSW